MNIAGVNMEYAYQMPYIYTRGYLITNPDDYCPFTLSKYKYNAQRLIDSLCK